MRWIAHSVCQVSLFMGGERLVALCRGTAAERYRRSLHVSTALAGILYISAAGQPTFGQSVTVTGEVMPGGATSPIWNVPGFLDVGFWGDGTLTILDGGVVSNTFGFIGYSDGANGTVTVSGAASKWTNTDGLHVGSAGTGTLAIENDGEVSSAYTRIGLGSGSTGTLNLLGAASGRGVLKTGYVAKGAGDATLNLNGGILRATQDEEDFLRDFGALTIGANGAWLDTNGHSITIDGDTTFSGAGSFNKTGPGTLMLTGDSSTFTGNTEVNGGTLEIAAGGKLSGSIGYISTSANSTGTVTVSGAGSKWTNNGTLNVGNSGTGTLTVEAGGEISSSAGFIGYYTGATGTVTVSGASSKWTNTGALEVGNSGSGRLTISNGGEVSSSGGFIGSHAASNGAVTVSGAGSKWTNANALYVGGGGTGTLTIENGGVVSSFTGTIGEHTGSTGTVTVSGAGSKWSNSNALYVGTYGNGTLAIENGGEVSSANAFIGYGPISTGTLNLLGSAASSRGVLETGYVAKVAGNTTLNLNGGILRATQDEGDFLRDFGALTIGAEGAWFDTNSHSITIDGGTTFSGSGTLNKTGPGTLTLKGDSSTHTGNTEVNGGTLAITSGGKLGGGTFGSSIGLIGNGVGSTGIVTVSGAGSKWTNANSLYVGGGGTGTLTIENGGEVSSLFGLIGNGVGSTGTVTVSGAGSKWTNTSSLSIGSLGTGGLTIDNAGQVSSTTGVIGNGTASNGTVSVSGAGSKWTNANTLYVGHLGTGTLTLSDGGTVSAGNGSGTVILGNENTGTITIGTAAGAAGAEAGTLEAASVEFWNGNGTLNFNHTGETVFSAGLLSNGTGTHAMNHLAGTTTLTGISSGFAGTTTILGGTLLVGDAAGNGILGGLVTVGQNGTLGGSGTLTGAVTIDGTLSVGNSPGTLTFSNNLTLNAGSTSVFELNSPGTVGGTGARGNDLVRVGGNLTLGGELDARVAAAGYYRLFEYGGTRSGIFAGGTVTGTGGFVPFDPNTADIRYEVPGQVNLSVLGTGQTLQFWDGSGPVGNSTVNGGDGIWQSFATNWTDDAGSANAGWGGSVGVFAGTAGTVTVQGSQTFDTLQFSADGYRIEGDALAIGVAGGGTFNIDNGVSATVASVVEDGAGSLLRKAGAGTLVLTGNNTYAGGNHLLGGVLSVASDANLGAVESGLTFDSGVLEVTGTRYTGTTRTILIGAGGGGFDIADAANTFTLSQNITGTGNLLKQGDGALVLTGANAYGSTRVEAGTLVGDAGSISGNIGNSSTVIFDQIADTNFTGNIGGVSGTEGTMIKRGGGDLILAGSSTLDWSVEDGTLVSSSNRFTGDLDITSGAGFVFDQANNGSYAGVLSGGGDVAFTGGGAITLTRDSSSFTGLSTVTGSTLIVTDTLGGSTLIGMDGRLAGAGTIGSGSGSRVTVADGGTLSGQTGSTLTVDGHLAIDAGSFVNVAIGGFSTTALFDVAGDLTLDGTVNVSDAGGFGAGVYRLFDYGGSLTNNGLDIGTVPGGIDADDLTVQTGVPGRVNLISSAGVDLGFWDGGNTSLHDNGQIDGGNGAWRADGSNWTSLDGIANGAFRPNPTYAVFQGSAGTVTVDDGAGALGIVGMQFVTDGYHIEGDAIALEGANGQSVIRVGDGSAAGALTTATIASALTGLSTLIKDDLGTLILTGANTYEGDTLVRAGTLIGNTASIRNDIGNASTVIFDQPGIASFAGNIGGVNGTSGEMILRGGGKLTLAGTSTLDWTVEDGALISATERFAGDLNITSGAGFTFDQDYNGTYTGALSGAGDLVFTGGGAITLTSDSSSFTGLSTVTGSTLIVTDTLGGSALIGMDGWLAGAGTIGSGAGSLVTIAAGGTLTPGNSIGTLIVDGDLVFDTGSRLEVEVNPQGRQSDLVEVTGRAMINGGGVVHIGANANYDLHSTYTILSAGELVGTFEKVTSNFAFLNPDLIYNYGAGTVDLELTRNDRDFASAALTRNQVATAKGIESIGFDAGHAVYDAVAQLADDTDLIRASFDALSGEIHASAKAALIEDSRFLRNAINDRVRAAFGDIGASVTPILAYGPGDTPVPVAADHAGPVFWSHGFGSWSSTDSDGNAASLDRSSGGLIGGTDGMVGDWRIGLLAGYSHSYFKASDHASSGSSDNYHLGFYGGTHWGDLAFRTGAAYTWHDIDTARWVSIPGITDSLSAGYNAGTLQAFGEMGYGFDMGNGVRFEPFANLAHVSLRSDGFTEAGGNAALTGYSQTTNVTFTTLGMRGEHAVALGTVDATFKGMLGWQHAFGDTTPTSKNAFTAGDAFSIAGSPIARDSAVIEAGLDLNLTPYTTFGLTYTSQIAAFARNHGFRASFNVSF